MAYKKIAEGRIKGWVREDILDLLPRAFFEDPISLARGMGARPIKESKLRWAAILTLRGGRRVFFKRDRTKGWGESLKYLLLPSKARKEWSMVYQLQKRNLNIPKPLGWMEKGRFGFVEESYYLSEAIGSGLSFIEEPVSPCKKTLVPELAKTVKKVHAAGLFHKDFHAGNFIRDGETFYLIDLHRAKVLRSLSLDQRLWNLSQLFYSLSSVWEEEDRLQFMGIYFEGEPLSAEKKEAFLQKADSCMISLQRRQWRSRSKRCLKESTEFSVEKEGESRFYHRREFSLNQLRKALEDHLEAVKGNSAALKKMSAEVIVSVVNDNGNGVCIKQFRHSSVWNWVREHFRRSKGKKAWIAANGLRVRGIPSLKALALVERRRWLGPGGSFFVMEASEADQEMDRYILSVNGLGDLHKRRCLVKAFAQWLSRFHRLNLYHKDMKTCNILVSEREETCHFRLLDLEDVQLDKKVNEGNLFRNFLQLNTSTPRVITRADRIRFFREYVGSNPIVKDQKAFLRQLGKESRKRGLVYVSPAGVVSEPI